MSLKPFLATCLAMVFACGVASAQTARDPAVPPVNKHHRGVATPAPATPATATPTSTTTAPAPDATTPKPRTAHAPLPAGTKVNLNTATAAELDALPSIGKARLKVIMTERAKGNFKDWDDFDRRMHHTSVNAGVRAKIKDYAVF